MNGKEFMKLTTLQQATLITELDTLDHCLIQGITVIEIPVENFVQKGEVVLTTAIGCEEPSTLLPFVQQIHQSGAAALVIATGHYVDQIDPTVVHYANQQQFPLIAIPWNIRFSEIIQEVLQLLYHRQHTLLKMSEEIHKKLFDLYIRKTDLHEVVQFISDRLQHPLMIVNKSGIINGRTRDCQPLIQLWNQYLQSTDHPSMDEFHSIHHPSDYPLEWLQLDNQRLYRLAIGYSNQIRGYLLFSLERDQSIEELLDEPFNCLLLEHAITVIALWFQRQHAIEITEMKLQGDLVWSLANGHSDSWESLMPKANSFGYNMSLPYTCLLALPENLFQIYQKQNVESSYEGWLKEAATCILERVNQTARSMKKETMVTFQKDTLIVYLEMSENSRLHHDCRSFINLLEKHLHKIYPQLILSWGIGESDTQRDSYQESYKRAKMALNIGRYQQGPGYRSTFSNTGSFRALQTLTDNLEIQKIAHSTIGTLLRYDEKRNIDLIHTLITYIRNQGKVSQTARELNLHRQSLIYRLQKIESLTHRSLLNPDDLFLLDLSLRLWTTGVLEKQDS